MLCMFLEKLGTDGGGDGMDRELKLGADYAEPFKLKLLLVLKFEPLGGFLI